MNRHPKPSDLLLSLRVGAARATMNAMRKRLACAAAGAVTAPPTTDMRERAAVIRRDLAALQFRKEAQHGQH